MAAPTSPTLAERIAQARDLPGRPHAQRLISPAGISEVFRQRCASTPNAPFLKFHDAGGAEHGSFRTYEEFRERVERLTGILTGALGVTRGSRIATALHNHEFAIELYFAAWHLGACVVPLNVTEEDRRVGHAIAHSHASVLVVFDEYAARLREMVRPLKTVEHVLTVSTGIPAAADRAALSNERSLQMLMDSEYECPGAPAVEPDDEALIVYTSGTTGTPKGVVLSQYNLAVDAAAISAWQRFDAGTTVMCVLPVHHVNGLVVTHLAPVVSGSRVVLNRKFSATTFFETVARNGVNVVSVVPTLLQFLLEACSADFDARTAAPSLKHVICGAGPLTVDLATRFEERFGIPICHGYGLSETTCYSCYLPLGQSQETHRSWMRDFGYPSIGVPLPVNVMAIHDEQGNALPEGQKGEIVVRGHNVTLGYYANPVADEAAFTHGWFRSGDEGFCRKDADGQRYFFISGRFKELIIRGGVKISPLEVDEVLNRVPGVKAALAIGFENVCYGEEVGAYVVRAADSTVAAETIILACRAVLPFWMSPKAVVFGDTLPVTSTGKYQRNQLKPLFGSYRETQFREK